MTSPDLFTGRLGNRMFQIAYLYARVKDGTIPDWYLQDPGYFKGYEEDIKQMFGKGIGYLSQVGIHIRRGDYIGNPFYVDLTQTDYYERAMALFPSEKFLVFSDDQEWCKEKFKDNPDVQVMDKGNEVEDLNLLASCKDIIIANSSFSFWAAYLNPNPSKRIIAPLQWHPDGVQRTKIPETWERI